MRADMYQSYGWLNAFSYKDNKPYSHRGAEAYLNINERTKRANKASGYEMVWRPVYSKAKKNPWFPSDVSYPSALTDQTISITQLSKDPVKSPHLYVRAHPNTLFVFGDNDQRRGKAGQAVIRDEPNAIGFRTKKAPRTSAKSAYYTDDEYRENVAKCKQTLTKYPVADYEKVHFIPGKRSGS